MNQWKITVKRRPKPVLKRGAINDDVRELQSQLNEVLGAGLKADGNFGSKTDEAVRRFQRQAGLKVDGIVGRNTWSALAKAEKPAGAPAAEGSAMVRRRGKTVPHYRQGDPRWKSRKLSEFVSKKQSIGAAGCAMTCAAMVLKYYGRDVNPLILDRFLDSQGARGYGKWSKRTQSFHHQNGVNWDAAFRCEEGNGSPRISGTRFVHKDMDAVISERLAKNIPTIGHVDYGRDKDTKGNHFVVIIGRTDSGDYIMNDPATASGDGGTHPNADRAILQRTTLKSGYYLRKLVVFKVS